MTAILLIAGLVAGKIALASLGIPEILTLASAGFTVAQVGVKVGQRLAKSPRFHRLPRGGVLIEMEREPRLCFQGAPSGWAARVCMEPK